MIIRKNATPSEVQKQVNSITRMSRGFNKSLDEVREGQMIKPSNNSKSSQDEMRKKVSNMNNLKGFNRWK